MGLLTVLMLLLSQVILASKVDSQLTVKKCCDVYEMLTADGESCVKAPWSPNTALHNFISQEYTIESQIDVKWMRKWFPPDVQPNKVRVNALYHIKNFSPTVLTVNSSVMWNNHGDYQKDFWNGRIVFYGKEILRPRKGLRFHQKTSLYCVDAISDFRDGFALVFKMTCKNPKKCIYKCCEQNEVIVAENRTWTCEDDNRISWSPSKSLFINPFTPFVALHGISIGCEKKNWRSLPLVLGDVSHIQQDTSTRTKRNFFASAWTLCMDFQRHDDGSMSEILLYCERPSLTWLVFFFLRPASFLASLLLLAALVAIATNVRLRITVHGWALASHAGCLLCFNLGQVVFFFDERNRDVFEAYFQKEGINHSKEMCPKIALAMYFFLIAAACWLTAVCVNMTLGFRRVGGVRTSGGGCEKRRGFTTLAAFAWGIPALLTTVSAFLKRSSVINRRHWIKNNDATWSSKFAPSFVETRTCYDEIPKFESPTLRDTMLLKSGSAIFYYTPVGILVLTNIACLVLTLRKIQFLRKGNSILKRDGLTELQESNIHNITLYIKMILMSGILEMMFESFAWVMTGFTVRELNFYTMFYDALVYRTTGYVCDLFRAAFVAWLAAPDGGYWGIFLRFLARFVRGARRMSRRRTVKISESRRNSSCDSVDGKWWREKRDDTKTFGTTETSV